MCLLYCANQRQAAHIIGTNKKPFFCPDKGLTWFDVSNRLVILFAYRCTLCLATYPWDVATRVSLLYVFHSQSGN
jgi:hypothetical protein